MNESTLAEQAIHRLQTVSVDTRPAHVHVYAFEVSGPFLVRGCVSCGKTHVSRLDYHPLAWKAVEEESTQWNR